MMIRFLLMHFCLGSDIVQEIRSVTMGVHALESEVFKFNSLNFRICIFCRSLCSLR